MPHQIAVLPGDGIGKEVMPQGLRVIEAAARRFNISLKVDHFDFACCDHYLAHGEMMPANWKEQIGGHDAIFFGAVGWPAAVPDHISLWGSPDQVSSGVRPIREPSTGEADAWREMPPGGSGARRH